MDLNNWSFEIGDGCPNLCGWGNNELQSYTDSNHRLEDGMLVISAKKETDYTSTRILTKDKQEFTYGRIETRVKVPTGAGLWPAFWALGADIDNCFMARLWRNRYNGICWKKILAKFLLQSTQEVVMGTQLIHRLLLFLVLKKGFTVFAIDWTKDYIDFFLDTNRVLSLCSSKHKLQKHGHL